MLLLHTCTGMHNPTTENRQGNDVGTQYRSVIFTHTPQQQQIAQEVTERVQKSGKINGRIVTQIQPADGLTFVSITCMH